MIYRIPISYKEARGKMKRNLKIIGLAAVLALCLLMTGCYQPPDEVNNGGQSGTTSTPFFKTIEPSPTIQVTPDTTWY